MASHDGADYRSAAAITACAPGSLGAANGVASNAELPSRRPGGLPPSLPSRGGPPPSPLEAVGTRGRSSGAPEPASDESADPISVPSDSNLARMIQHSPQWLSSSGCSKNNRQFRVGAS